jgi:hypothetical protein
LIFDNTFDWTKNHTIAENQNVKAYKAQCEYTVQKLKSYQIFEEVHGKPDSSVSLGQSFWGTYTISDISEAFFDLIKESGYYEEYKHNLAGT